ncbi:MAG: hypothetical protein JSR77_11275 [Planctomycetes bacterium]|nr:hypothetical protein [Planctomycetota bacterium]
MTEWAGWALVAVGAAVAVRGLWGDRARGRRRCPKCFYGLDGVKPGAEGYTCPECGREGIAEKSLYRARASRRMVLGGIALALMSNALFAVPRVGAAGWVGCIPTLVLAGLAPWQPATDVPQWRAPLNSELDRRQDKERSVHLPAAWVWTLSTRALHGFDDDGAGKELVFVNAAAVMRACGGRSDFEGAFSPPTTRLRCLSSSSGDIESEWTAGVMRVISGMVRPEAWWSAGGTISDAGSAGMCIVTRTPPEDAALIRALYGALCAPVASPHYAAGIGSAIEDAAVVSRLRQTVVRVDGAPRTLAALTKEVSKASGVEIELDTAGIEDAPVFLGLAFSLRAGDWLTDQLLDAGLSRMLGGRGDRVDWYVKDGRVVVTHADTAERLCRRMVVYSVEDLIANRPASELTAHDDSAFMRLDLTWMLVELLTSNIDPDGWVNNGGDRAQLEVLGDRLVIQAPQRTHERVIAFLGALRSKLNASEGKGVAMSGSTSAR